MIFKVMVFTKMRIFTDKPRGERNLSSGFIGVVSAQVVGIWMNPGLHRLKQRQNKLDPRPPDSTLKARHLAFRKQRTEIRKQKTENRKQKNKQKAAEKIDLNAQS